MTETEIDCPFCGENFTVVIDTSQAHQAYIEDCYVCCRPIQFKVTCEDGEFISVDVSRD